MDKGCEKALYISGYLGSQCTGSTPDSLISKEMQTTSSM